MLEAERPMYALVLIPFVVIVALAALAVMVDVRTGRTYGLAILSSLLLACTGFVIVTVTVVAQRPEPAPASPHRLGEGVVLVLYFVPAAGAMLLILIGAAIVARSAGHWRWIGGFLAAVLVPVLVAALPHPFLDMRTGSFVQNVGYIGILVVPEATMLTYSITRLVHPVAPTPPRQLAPLD
jgi:hypothetical protein